MSTAPRSRVTLGERAFHRWVQQHLPAGKTGRLPLGDDAAAVPVGAHRVTLLSSDALVERVHFLRSSPPGLIGEAATAVNLSDIAAKGGHPLGVLIDLLVPVDTPSEWAQSVVTGAERMAARFGCHVLGGDTKPAPVRCVVGVSVGWVDPRLIPPRSGARPGDLVVTTGVVGFGGAWRENPTRALRVRPRVSEGQILGPEAHAMMDTSDGVADAAHQISEASGCKVILQSARLPLHPRLKARGAPTSRRLAAAFYGGDYELFATIAPARLPRVRAALGRAGTSLTVIGRVERGRGAWLDHAGRTRPLPPAGWHHFRRP